MELNKIWMCWTDNNPLSEIRKNIISTWRDKNKNVTLVTPDNLDDFVDKNCPLHDCYTCLSSVHKSDYLRVYLLHIHGGAYFDIKNSAFNISAYANTLLNSDKIGYVYIKNKNIISACSFILKPNSELTTHLIKSLNDYLDNYRVQLKQYPALHSRHHDGLNPSCKFDRTKYPNGYKYPLDWGYMTHTILKQAFYEFKDKLFQDFPMLVCSNYANFEEEDVTIKDIREVTFVYDNNLTLKIPENIDVNKYYENSAKEPEFRKIVSILTVNNIIKNNIIDCGAYIGDNAIIWAKNYENIKVYAIDPGNTNISMMNDICKFNSITNCYPIQEVVSHKEEIVSTNYGLNHCPFNSNTKGKHKLNSTTLDILHEKNIIENIGFIHLDAEGFEFKIINGSIKLIDKYTPVIIFEQHLSGKPLGSGDIEEGDDYIKCSNFIKQYNYRIFIIDVELQGCRKDCRNILALHNSLDIENIQQLIHSELKINILKEI